MKKFTPLLLFFLLNTGVLLSQVDTVPPVIQSHGLHYGMPGCYDSLYLSELVDTVYDNYSAFNTIKMGLRIGCTGQESPVGINVIWVRANELIAVEIWAQDEAGNIAVDTVMVYGVDPGCDPDATFVARTPPLTNTYPLIGIHHVDFRASLNNCSGDTIDEHYQNLESDYYDGGFGFVFPIGYNGAVTAEKNINPLNGVTTADLVSISKHILGVEPFDSPYKLIAADANQDGKVTIYDVVILRKLILGITDELPNGKSWRFIPENYTFPDPADPFQTVFPEQFDIINGESQYGSPYFFIGIKIGDVNFSADPSQ